MNTFGQRAVGSNLREAVRIDLTPVGGGKVLLIEAFVVPEISRVQNEHLEIVRKDYPHLSNTWLSDVCKERDDLEIDVLIGADYLWTFQAGNVVRGEAHEPVAVETELGWVILGPLTYSQSADKGQVVQVNFVGSDGVSPDSLDRNVQRLWDLETLGVTACEGVYEEFIESIELMSARILAQLMETVKKALESQLEISRVKYWLDSKTALCWIQNRGEWKQFVRHRVNEILKFSNKKDWGHCSGEENPADIGSRRTLGSKLKEEKLWWCGPE